MPTNKIPSELLTAEINEELYEKYKEDIPTRSFYTPELPVAPEFFTILTKTMMNITPSANQYYSSSVCASSNLYTSVDDFLADIRYDMENYFKKCKDQSKNDGPKGDILKFKIICEREYIDYEYYNAFKLVANSYRVETFNQFKSRVEQLRKSEERKKLSAEKQREKNKIKREKDRLKQIEDEKKLLAKLLKKHGKDVE